MSKQEPILYSVKKLPPPHQLRRATSMPSCKKCTKINFKKENSLDNWIKKHGQNDPTSKQIIQTRALLTPFNLELQFENSIENKLKKNLKTLPKALEMTVSIFIQSVFDKFRNSINSIALKNSIAPKQTLLESNMPPDKTFLKIILAMMEHTVDCHNTQKNLDKNAEAIIKNLNRYTRSIQSSSSHSLGTFHTTQQTLPPPLQAHNRSETKPDAPNNNEKTEEHLNSKFKNLKFSRKKNHRIKLKEDKERTPLSEIYTDYQDCTHHQYNYAQCDEPQYDYINDTQISTYQNSFYKEEEEEEHIYAEINPDDIMMGTRSSIKKTNLSPADDDKHYINIKPIKTTAEPTALISSQKGYVRYISVAPQKNNTEPSLPHYQNVTQDATSDDNHYLTPKENPIARSNKVKKTTKEPLPFSKSQKNNFYAMYVNLFNQENSNESGFESGFHPHQRRWSARNC